MTTPQTWPKTLHFLPQKCSLPLATGFQTAFTTVLGGGQQRVAGGWKRNPVPRLGLGRERDVIPQSKTHFPMLWKEFPSTVLPQHPLHWEDAFAISLLAPRAGRNKSTSV